MLCLSEDWVWPIIEGDWHHCTLAIILIYNDDGDDSSRTAVLIIVFHHSLCYLLLILLYWTLLMVITFLRMPQLFYVGSPATCPCTTKLIKLFLVSFQKDVFLAKWIINIWTCTVVIQLCSWLSLIFVFVAVATPHSFFYEYFTTYDFLIIS